MRSLTELIDNTEPAWPMVQEWIQQAAVPVEILPTTRDAGEAALLACQITTRSPMGSIAYNSAGIFIDQGWLRVLGSGKHARFQRSLSEWNAGRSDGYYLVADDIAGGSFAINGGALGTDQGKIYYYAPDTLRWEVCGLSYSEFLLWAMTEKLHQFYDSLRWDGWTDEVKQLNGDQAMNIIPFLFTAGPPIKKRSRRAISVAEQFDLQFDLQRQLDGNNI